MHYTPENKEGLENNEADYNSRHPEPNAGDSDGNSKNQAEFQLTEPEKGFEGDVMAVA